MHQLASSRSWLTPRHVGVLTVALGLSPRQAMVALLGLEGHTETVIGERLGVSRHTVRHHFKRLYEKLRLSSRAAMSAAVLSVLLASQPDLSQQGVNRA